MSINSVGLSKARYVLREEETHHISLSADYLWRSYPLDDDILTEVNHHLIQTHWFSEQGKWCGIRREGIYVEDFAALGGDGSEAESFAFFAPLSNTILEYLRHISKSVRSLCGAVGFCVLLCHSGVCLWRS